MGLVIHCVPFVLGSHTALPRFHDFEVLKEALITSLEFLTRGFSHSFPGHLTSSLHLTFSRD